MFDEFFFVNSIMACTRGIVLSRYYFQFQASNFILNVNCNLKYIVTHILCTLFPCKPYWLQGEFFPYLNLPHSWSFPYPQTWPNGTLQIQLHGDKLGFRDITPRLKTSYAQFLIGCLGASIVQMPQNSFNIHLVFETHCNYCPK
jgi:hypothetical protein